MLGGRPAGSFPPHSVTSPATPREARVDPRSIPRRARALQRVLALIAAMTLVLGLVSPAAAAPKTPTLPADWSKLEPALADQIKARPTTLYDVIVTRQPAAEH